MTAVYVVLVVLAVLAVFVTYALALGLARAASRERELESELDELAARRALRPAGNVRRLDPPYDQEVDT